MSRIIRIVLPLALLVLVLSTTSAVADPPARRYGRKTATADALSLGAVLVGTGITFVGFLSEHDCYEDGDGSSCDRTLHVGLAITAAGVGGYLLASPLIHLGEDNPGGAGRSLALRAVPFLALALASQSDGTLQDLGVAVAVASTLVTPFIDGIWNARVAVAPTGGGLTAGLVGSF